MTDAAAAAQHTAVTVARRRGGARDVAAAGDGAVTDHHHSAQRSRERAMFHVTVTRLRVWRRRRVAVAGAARARGALVGSGGGVAFAERRCRQWRRLLHPPPRVTDVRRTFRLGRSKKFFRPWALFFARAHATGAPGLGAQAKTTLGRAAGVQ